MATWCAPSSRVRAGATVVGDDGVSTPLLVDAAVAGLFAGAVAVLVTVVIERLGGVVGGLLGTLPTTIVPASIGIARASSSTDAMQAALFAVPAGMLLNALYLALWRFLPARLPASSFGGRLALMLSTSLGLWAAAAFLLVTTLDEVALGAKGAAGVAALTALVGLVLTRVQPASAKTAPRRVGPVVLVARGLAASLAVGAGVVIAARGGDAAAGIASVFPAIFLTTMVSLWLAQGEAVSASAVGPMMVGSTSVSAYAVLAALLFPSFGLAVGAAVAWGLAAVAVQLPLFFAVRTVVAARGRAQP